MRKLILFTTGIALVLVIGIWLYAKPGAPRVPATAATATPATETTTSAPTLVAENSSTVTAVAPSTSTSTPPAIGAVAAAPDVIAVNTSTAVTVTAHITDSRLIPASVNLLRLNGSGTQPTILGHLQGNGSGTYSIQVTFTEASPGQIQLQVSAAFRGYLRRVLSPVVQVGVGMVLTDTDTGFSVLVPPSLYNLTDENTPLNSFDLESSPQGVAIGGGVLRGSSVATSGFAVSIDAMLYNLASSFDMSQYLAAEYPNSAADASITPIVVGGKPGYEIFFTGEETGNWPVAVVYHNGYVYRVLYSSTDNIPGFSDQNGLKAFNEVVEHLTFSQ